MRTVRLAIFETGTSSNNTMDLPEKGAITTSVGSRHSVCLLLLSRVGVILTWSFAKKTKKGQQIISDFKYNVKKRKPKYIYNGGCNINSLQMHSYSIAV